MRAGEGNTSEAGIGAPAAAPPGALAPIFHAPVASPRPAMTACWIAYAVAASGGRLSGAGTSIG